MHLVQLSLEELYTFQYYDQACTRVSQGKGKTFFVTGLMSPTKKSPPPHWSKGTQAPRERFSFVSRRLPSTTWVLLDGCVRVFPHPPLATQSADKRSDDRCNRGMDGKKKEEHNHHQMPRPWAP